MRVAQGVGKRGADRDQLELVGTRGRVALRERFPVDELADEVERVVIGERLVEGDDRGVREARRS